MQQQGILGDAGYTLLELMIAITLLGLLSLLMFSSLNFGTRVWERTQRAGTDINKIRLVQENLRQDLSRLYPAMLGTAGEGHIDFDGQPDRIHYLRVSGEVPGAFEDVELKLEGNDEPALSEQSKLELGTPGNAKDRILLKGVQSLEFSYFGSGRDADKTPSWTPNWQSRTVPPALIRMRVIFVDQSLQWPDLIIAPRIQTDVGCIFDVLTKTCQGRV